MSLFLSVAFASFSCRFVLNSAGRPRKGRLCMRVSPKFQGLCIPFFRAPGRLRGMQHAGERWQHRHGLLLLPQGVEP